MERDRSNRARNPSKGIRQRLRTAVRNTGFKGKFRTDENRDKSLSVISSDCITLPFTVFEGRVVNVVRQFVSYNDRV